MTEDASWSNCFYYFDGMESTTDSQHNMGSSASTLGTKLYTDAQFTKLETAFGNKGIPVVIGEYGAIKRLDEISGDNLALHLKGRAAWYGSVAKYAKAHNIVAFAWDTGDEGNGNMTIIRRQTKYGTDVGTIVDIEPMNALREAYGMTALDGSSIIDSLVTANQDTSNKMLQLTYTTAQSDSSEVGTMRIDLGGKDWSDYIGIQFDANISVASAGPAGSDQYGWTSVSVFAMTGSSWNWHDYNLEVTTGSATYKVLFSDFSNDFDKSVVDAIGINVYGTQLSGTIKMDNLVLLKADGSTEVLNNFDKKLPSIEGIASGELVTSEFGTVTAIKSVHTVAAGKLHVNVQQGLVNATFSAAKAGNASAMLVNGLGQVVASQNFAARAGTNSVQLKANFRGPAMLIVKQGSQMFTTKMNIR